MRTAPLLALLLLTACPGVKSKLCGGKSEPCCTTGDACQTGNVCDSAKTCVACGGANQACCAGNTCTGQLSCTANVCSMGCTDPCTLGQSRCSGGGGIESCSTGSACPSWQPLLSVCPGGTSCMQTASGADCVQLCAINCTTDALQCSVNGLERCVLASGAACPTLASEPDDSSAPQCVTGAQDAASLVWESPTPQGAPVVGIAGDYDFSYWVLDSEGNILHNAMGEWTYELRTTEGHRAMAIASCGAGSYLYAVGEAGTVYRRSGGTWTMESAGTTVDLHAVACDSALVAWAAGADGKLYVRNGSWTSYPTGFNGNVTAVGYVFSYLKIALAGAAGQIVLCDITNLPPTCAAQASGTTADLNAAWGDTFLGHIFVAGDNGTLLEWDGNNWSALDTKGSTAKLRAVSGVYDSVNDKTIIVAVGDNGAFFGRVTNLVDAYTGAPKEPLSAVMAVDPSKIFFTSLSGGIYFLAQAIPPNDQMPAARGGTKPITDDLDAVATLGMGRLFAVGKGGTRFRRENATWLDDRQGLAVTQDLDAVIAISQGEVYAAGVGGRLLARRFGTWFDDAPGLTTKNLEGLAFDADTIYAVGAGGTWLEKPRSGGAWTVVAQAATSENLWGVVVVGDGLGHTAEVVAVGDNCTVVSKANGAFTLVPVAACPAGGELFSVAVSNGELYAAGDPHLVVHRVDHNWTREFFDTNSLEAVTALVPQGSTLWALTTSGGAYQRITTWAQFEPKLAPNHLYGGVYDPDQGLFIVGQHGLVWRKP
ncbi:MAG: hypothetical protein QM723_10705 [Myxococcaceae bacterium]